MLHAHCLKAQNPYQLVEGFTSGKAGTEVQGVPHGGGLGGADPQILQLV